MTNSDNRTHLVLSFIFIITGLYWILVSIFGQGVIFLIFPGFANIITFILLLFKGKIQYKKSMFVATSLYNLILFSYQTFASISLLWTGLNLFIITTIFGYFSGTVVFLVLLLLFNFLNRRLFTTYPQFSEDKRKSINKLSL